jgi:biotin transport system substrate-specific component
MAPTVTTPNTLLGRIAPIAATKVGTSLLTVVVGSLLLTLSAKISVPVQPVPVTLQSFAVAALAAALGWRMALATVAAYIVQGFVGLPVFATGGGASYLLGPSGGFIIAWLPMAYIVGRAADEGASGRPFALFLAMLAAMALQFVFGFAWLLAVATMIVNSGAALPAWLSQGDLATAAFNGAVRPFIIWEILKMALATATVTGAWALLGRKR